MNNSLNVLVFFQIQSLTPHGTLGDFQHLGAVHSVLPTVQTSLWGRGTDSETSGAGLDLAGASTISAPVPAPASIPIPDNVVTQPPAQILAVVGAQNQLQVPVSAQAAAMPQTTTLLKSPTSIPIQVPTAIQAAVSAPAQPLVSASGPILEQTEVSSVSILSSKPEMSVPGLVSGPNTLPAPVQSAAPVPAPASVTTSVPAPVLQPPGTQTTVSIPECSSLPATQQTADMASASSTPHQEPCAEVVMNPMSVNI